MVNGAKGIEVEKHVAWVIAEHAHADDGGDRANRELCTLKAERRVMPGAIPRDVFRHAGKGEKAIGVVPVVSEATKTTTDAKSVPRKVGRNAGERTGTSSRGYRDER